jgi:hypothetical protein
MACSTITFRKPQKMHIRYFTHVAWAFRVLAR